MPITPLHFGISGSVSSILSSRVDIISSILANILLDVQPFLVVFFDLKIELHGISHTLLFAVILCVLFFALYGFVVKRIFHIKKPISVFIFGGVLGGILHVVLDSFYHSDVKPFYPFSNTNFAYFDIAYGIEILCLIGWVVFFSILFVRWVRKSV